MADAPRSTNLVSKRSRDLKKAEPSAANRSPLPKVKHRDKKAGFVLDEKQKAELKAQFDALCRPLEGKEERVDNWIQLNARKDKDIEGWLKAHTAAFQNLVRFNPMQFQQCLQAQDYMQPDAAKYTNALVVSQSAFSSTSNYNAAREVVKLVAKSVIWTPKQLLEKLRNISEAGVLPSNLEAAAGDVGSKSQAIRTLLTLTADLQGQGERSEESVAADIQALNLALAWLNKKRSNTSRHSAPTGTITLDALKNQAKTVSIKPSPGKEERFTREASRTESPPSTPRGEAQRDEKTGEKPKHKSKSRSKMTEEPAPGSGSASKREKSGSAEDGDNTLNMASSRRAHQRQTSGIGQNPHLMADLNQALQKKN